MPTPLWRNRDFMLLQAGQLLSTLGSGLSGIAYPLLALALTGSAAKAGYVGAVRFLPLVLFALPAGVAADRLDRRLVMIASDVAGATSVGLLAALAITHHATLLALLAVAFVDSTSSVFFRAGNSGAFRAVVPAEQLADASSVSMARASVVSLSSGPIGGALFGIARSLPFLTDAISYAFSTVSLLLMRTRFQEERRPEARTDLREGLAFFWQMPFLRTTVSMIAVSNFAALGVPLTIIVLAKRHGISSVGIGALISVIGAATLLGSIASPLLRRLFPMRAILLSEYWMASVYALFLAFPSVYVLVGCVALHAFTFPNTDSAVAAYSYTLIPDRLLGRAMSASNTIRVAAGPLGPLVAGLLLTHASPRITVLTLTAPVVVAALLGTLSPSMRDLPSLSASPAAAD
ncbi:MAG TPA: MFS transporter [Gaiellaceae bacterium]|nr:MFS transporter [Gaiellaceae bacterium]